MQYNINTNALILVDYNSKVIPTNVILYKPELDKCEIDLVFTEGDVYHTFDDDVVINVKLNDEIMSPSCARLKDRFRGKISLTFDNDFIETLVGHEPMSLYHTLMMDIISDTTFGRDERVFEIPLAVVDTLDDKITSVYNQYQGSTELPASASLTLCGNHNLGVDSI